MEIKIGQCYVAKFAKVEMPVRIESQKDNGIWLSRSLTHGRIVFVRQESQLLHECSDGDLSEFAKTITPNRRQRSTLDRTGSYRSEQQVTLPMVTCQHNKPTVRKPVKKQPRAPEFGLTLVEAAYRILKQSKRPLSSQEIVDQALAKKMHRSNGTTPANTVNAALLRIIKKDGDSSRFVKVGRGMFTVK